MDNGPSFTIGLEEEYHLVERDTGNLIDESPPEMIEAFRRELGPRYEQELLQSQVEVMTSPHRSMQQLREELGELRRTAADIAGRYDFDIIAASTHPWANWVTQQHSKGDRYQTLADTMQAVARRMMICGMHVHVGLDDDALRIDIMSQAAYILPHLLALSTSSPFIEGEDTGLMSFRCAVSNELPRTGLPGEFDNLYDYERQVAMLIEAGIIEDAGKIWWDIRPSAHLPTLELRITDICTRIDDAVCIAAMYRCWLRMLCRLKHENQRWRRYNTFLIAQNRWLAQRFSVDRGLMDFGKGRLVPYPELLDELLAIVRPDAEFFDCVTEVEHARVILARGTSAHRQRETFRDAKAEGRSIREALRDVVSMLARETLLDT